MDFRVASGFNRQVHPSRANVLRLLPFTVGLLLTTGCVTSQPETAPAKVASLQAQPETTGAIATTPAGKEIACRIQMINGVEAQASDSLKPGHHRVIIALGSAENEHVGDVDLLIPAAKNYRLKAERNDETFTLSLIEVDTGKVAATSAALVDQVMKFKVFVGQK